MMVSQDHELFHRSLAYGNTELTETLTLKILTLSFLQPYYYKRKTEQERKTTDVLVRGVLHLQPSFSDFSLRRYRFKPKPPPMSVTHCPLLNQTISHCQCHPLLYNVSAFRLNCIAVHFDEFLSLLGAREVPVLPLPSKSQSSRLGQCVPHSKLLQCFLRGRESFPLLSQFP